SAVEIERRDGTGNCADHGRNGQADSQFDLHHAFSQVTEGPGHCRRHNHRQAGADRRMRINGQEHAHKRGGENAAAYAQTAGKDTDEKADKDSFEEALRLRSHMCRETNLPRSGFSTTIWLNIRFLARTRATFGLRSIAQ